MNPTSLVKVLPSGAHFKEEGNQNPLSRNVEFVRYAPIRIRRSARPPPTTTHPPPTIRPDGAISRPGGIFRARTGAGGFAPNHGCASRARGAREIAGAENTTLPPAQNGHCAVVFKDIRLRVCAVWGYVSMAIRRPRFPGIWIAQAAPQIHPYRNTAEAAAQSFSKTFPDAPGKPISMGTVSRPGAKMGPAVVWGVVRDSHKSGTPRHPRISAYTGCA